MSKPLISFRYFKCEKCEGDINAEEEFKFFDDRKICMDCWGKLLMYFENELD